jgi:hypothetical protein
MKKYILVLFLVICIIPSVALASWWNPFTWNWLTHKNQTTVEIPLKKTTAPIVQPITNTTNNIPNKNINPAPSVKTKKINTVTNPTIPVDVCKNIEGIQTFTPSGMILQDGNCITPIPNIQQPSTVDIPQSAPVNLTVISATSITDNSATLNVNLVSGAPANVSFSYYMLSSVNDKKTTPIVYQFNNGNFSAQISGLQANTTYQFYASAYNGSTSNESNTWSFTTLLAPGTCVAGQSWDKPSGTCITTPTCSTGQFWSSYSGKCCQNRDSSCYPHSA